MPKWWLVNRGSYNRNLNYFCINYTALARRWDNRDVFLSLFWANLQSGLASSRRISLCCATSVSHIQTSRHRQYFYGFSNYPCISIKWNGFVSLLTQSIMSTSQTLRVIYWVMLCYVYCNSLHLSEHQRCLLCKQSTWQYKGFCFWFACRHRHTHIHPRAHTNMLMFPETQISRSQKE